MIVILGSRAVTLADVSDLSRFSVRRETDLATAAGVLTASRAGRIAADGDAWISMPWLRFAAGDTAESPRWREGFARLQSTVQVDEQHLGAPIEQGALGQPRYRVAVVGLGNQGAGIVRALRGRGHDVVAGVDIGAKVGRRIAEVVDGYDGDGVVLGSVGALIETHPDLDLVALAASADLARTLEWSGVLLDAGINVVTLNHHSFAYGARWTPELDARAKRGGASFMSVGIQDIAFVQLMTVASAAVTDLRRISLVNVVPIEVLSSGIIGLLGIGQSPEEARAIFAARPPRDPEADLVAGPLLEVARRLGLTPRELETAHEVIEGESPYEWRAGGRTLAVGEVHVVRDTTSFDTAEGIRFEGAVVVQPGGEEISENVIELDADPTMRATLSPLTTSVTDTALVSRVPDIVEGPPGVLFSADTAPARYHRPAVDSTHTSGSK